MSNASAKPRPKSSNGVKPEALAFNIDDLSLGDCMDIEEITGEPAFATFAAAAENRMSAKAMAALVWVTKRRRSPTFTFEEAKQTRVSTLAGTDGSEAQDPR